MRLASWRSKVAIPAATFVLGVAVATAGTPVWKAAVMVVNQAEFGELTYRCDQAMRSHMIAKQKLVTAPSNEAVHEVEAMEIGLLDCQDYDMMRKRLIRWGLTDNELSEMSLRAVEERAGTLKDVVRIHEIRY